MHQLTQSYEFERVAPDGTAATTFTLAAGTTDVNSAPIDLQASNGATVVIALGTITATGTYTATIEHSDASGSGYTAISGLSAAINADTDDNKLLVIDVVDPVKRYIRVVSDRGTANSVIDSIIAIKKRRYAPVTQGATVEAVDL